MHSHDRLAQDDGSLGYEAWWFDSGDIPEHWRRRGA
jgi:hypothetical protein